MDKKWYTSKTLWANGIAIAASFFAPDTITPDLQVKILAVINLILRLVTKSEIKWS